MITSFKIFEINQEPPQVGDYVILYYQNKIGQIIGVIPNIYYTDDNDTIDKTEYNIEWKIAEKDIKTITTTFKMVNLKYWAKTKEELEKLLREERFDL